jgi:hypothetical protein
MGAGKWTQSIAVGTQGFVEETKQKLGELDSTPEKRVAGSIVIDYEENFSKDVTQPGVPADAERPRR